MGRHVDGALKYAHGCLEGDYVVGHLTKLACQRFLDDLDAGVWEFSHARAEHVCDFIELLPHIKGRWATKGETIKLEAWQQWKLCNVFGFVDPETGLRRFQQAYTEVARKNAKSTESAGVGLYMLTADGEAGAEVYAAASTRDQAKIVFGVAQAMARRTPAMRKRFSIEVFAHGILDVKDARKFEPLSAEGSTMDGLNTHCGIIDELHAHKKRDVFDVIESSRGSRDQALLWIITTAGHNRSGICYEQRSYVKAVLEGKHRDDRAWGCIWTIDEDDDWTDPECWPKANPNWGVSVNPDVVHAAASKAMRLASAQSEFLTKYLNVWVNADIQWLDIRDWDKAARPLLSMDDFEGEECYCAIDLANYRDMATRLMLFPRDNKLFVFCNFYLPSETIASSDNAQYKQWVADGLITETPGYMIDFEFIEEDLKADAARFKIIEVAFDPYQARQFSVRMDREGLPMVEVTQSLKNMSDPMLYLEAKIIAGDVYHDGDPCLSWQMGNVVCHKDAKGRVYPRRENDANKIDGPVSLMMALNRYLAHKQAEQSVYDTRGVVDIEL